MTHPTQFKPGQSGNPKGKPKGAKDRRTRFREMIEPHAPELVKKVIQLALSGNKDMLRLLVDRLIPPAPRDQEIPFINLGKTSEEAFQSLNKLLEEGELTPAQLSSLTGNIALKINSDEVKSVREDQEKLREQIEKITKS